MLSHPGCPPQPPDGRHARGGDRRGHRRLSSRRDSGRRVAGRWQAQTWRGVRWDCMGGWQAWGWGWEVGIVGGWRWGIAWCRGRDGGWGEGSWGRGHRGRGWVGGIDVGVVGKVSRRAVGRGQGAVGGALGLHHGLQALVALSRHVGAGGRHPRHVAGRGRGRGPVWQWWWLVHRGRVGRRRNLDFGEVASIHWARRLGLT